MPPSIPPSESFTQDRSANKAPLAFDVAWLLGEKEQPDPLPDREELQSVRKSARTPRRRRLTVNVLASLFVLGSVATVATVMAPKPLQNLLSWFSSPSSSTYPDESTQPSEIDPREANETIEAILALQELAAQSDGKPNPTQKR
jgi:hypothetical protein